MHGFNEYGGGLAPPTLHVGVKPVHAYGTNISEDKVQEVVAIFEVQTSVEIEYSFDFTHPFGNYVHPVMKVMGDSNRLKLDDSYEHAYDDYCFNYRAWVPTEQNKKTLVKTPSSTFKITEATKTVVPLNDSPAPPTIEAHSSTTTTTTSRPHRHKQSRNTLWELLVEHFSDKNATYLYSSPYTNRLTELLSTPNTSKDFRIQEVCTYLTLQDSTFASHLCIYNNNKRVYEIKPN